MCAGMTAPRAGEPDDRRHKHMTSTVAKSSGLRLGDPRAVRTALNAVRTSRPTKPQTVQPAPPQPQAVAQATPTPEITMTRTPPAIRALVDEGIIALSDAAVAPATTRRVVVAEFAASSKPSGSAK